MKNTSEIEEDELRKLEVMFASQEKLLLEHHLDPKGMTLFQRGDKVLKSWEMASIKMDMIKNHSVSELFKDKQAEALMHYGQLFSWVINMGLYLGIDPKLLFNIYRFQNEERSRGIHS